MRTLNSKSSKHPLATAARALLAAALVLVLGARASAADICPEPPSQADMDLGPVLNTLSNVTDVANWFAGYFNLENGDWDEGWGFPARQPVFHYGRMFDSAFLLTYGIEDTPADLPPFDLAENLTQTSPIGSSFRVYSKPQVLVHPGTEIGQHLFAVNTADHLIHYYWFEGSGWAAEDLTNYANIGSGYNLSSVGKITALNYVAFTSLGQDFGTSQHVFGSNASGEVIHYYWDALNGWGAANLSTATGSTLQGAPVIVKWPSTSSFPSGPSVHVFGRASSDVLIHFYREEFGGWVAENLTSATNGPYFTGDPVAVSGPNNSRHVFARTATGDLVHYWAGTSGWAGENLTQYANIGNNYRISGPPAVVDGPNNSQHVFGRNLNGDLIHYYWSAQAGWAAENLTQYANIGNVYRMSSDPQVLFGPGAALHVFSNNSSSDLIQYYWSPQQGWAAENLTSRGGLRISSGITPINGMGTAQHVYGRHSSGDLIHYFWTPISGWFAENLSTRLPGTLRIGPLGPVVMHGPRETHHVFGLASSLPLNNADVMHFKASSSLPLRSWHSDQDYYQWASGQRHGFDYEPAFGQDVNARAHYGIPLVADEVDIHCPSLDDNPATRAGTMLHESTHIIYYQGHESVAPCPDDCADRWYSHGVIDYPWGTLDPDTHKHSMNQIKIEYLSDIGEFSDWWVPSSVFSSSCGEANQLMDARIINPPGWRCGRPRPF